MKLKYLLAASVAGLTAATAFPPSAAMAQQITSGIEGRVVDDAGNPVVGATVEVTDTRTGATRTITTDADGSFSATNLTVGGPYTVSAAAGGFEGQTINDITTSLQGNTSLTFTLTTGTGEIVVTGSRVRVTQLAVGPGTSFNSEVLANAPSFNRDVRDVIRIDPRVSLDRDDGGSGVDRISCLGGNDRGNAFTVDGISQGDVYGLNDTGFSSRSSTPVPYDAIRETQVQFAPFDVDYANFTGCAINVVTKSGTNALQLGGFFEYSDSGMRGDSIIVDGVERPVAPIEPEKRYGAYLGGPVIPDRLFLFGAYEFQEAGQSQDDGPNGGPFANPLAGVSVAQFNEIADVLRSTYGIDPGPLVTNRPFQNERWFARADLQITDDHRLEATYQRLEESTTRADDFFTGAASPQVTGANTFYLSGTKSDYYSARLYSQWTDKFSTELRFSRSEVQDLQDPVGGGEAQSANPIPRIIVGVDNATGPDGTVLAGPGTSRSANDLRTNIDQYRAVAQIEAGAHSFKLGLEANHANLFNLFVQNATGTLVFRNVADLRAGLLSPGTGNNQTNTTPANVVPGLTEGAFGNFSATGNVNDAAAQFTRTIYSAFAQDEWQINDNLLLTAGVRADFFDGGRPDYNPNFFARYGIANNAGFSDLDPLVMPRVALTYDVADFAVFSRAQLRAGVGVFSGGDPLVWFGNAFQNDGSAFALASTQAAGCPAGQIDVVVNGQFTGVPSCFRNAAIATASAGQGFTQSIDPDIKVPSVLRANIGFQSELNFADTGFFSGWNLNLDYIFSRTNDAYTIVDLSQTLNPTAGLGGRTIDGRPIYVTIDPLRAGCTARLTDITPTPIYTGVTAACITTAREDELMLTNAGPFNSHNASAILSKQFDGGIFTEGGSTFFSLGYAYSGAQDRRNMYNSTAGSNYDLTAAFDRQNPAASRGFFSSRHNISLSTSFAEEFLGDDLETRFGFTFIARSGRPYSLTFSGGSVFSDNASGTENALIYLPTGPTDPNISPTSNARAVQDLVDFASTLDCAKDYIGRSIERNTCSNDWFFDLDLTFSQELPGPGRFFGRDDRFKVYAMVDNFLNLLDSSWNLQRRRDFAGRQELIGVSGVDAQGRYIITPLPGGCTAAGQTNCVTPASNFAADNGVNVSSSVWRLKVGVSYEF
ncbi:TonB-dependent receptor [Qipengyuania sediminis]|uniref:TonB-dependent receptor n=1 Tax=Qipengyuania sediminis TaxID=1532023 RepID=UPI0010599259|nr:TonB-dependent receptor [Qipengyuania sediminis]